MKFDMSRNMRLCFTTLIIFACIGGVAGFLFMHDPPSDNIGPIEAVQAQPKQPVMSSPLPARTKVPIKKTHVCVQTPPLPEPTLLQDLSEEFTTYALKTTDAEKIRVESKHPDGRGYVAFMARSEGFERGIPTVMQELAQIYLDTFQNAPAITLSLIIGGGVKGQMTFLRDEEGAAILPGQHEKKAAE